MITQVRYGCSTKFDCEYKEIHYTGNNCSFSIDCSIVNVKICILRFDVLVSINIKVRQKLLEYSRFK